MDESLTRKENWENYARIVNTKTSSKSASFELTVENCLGLLDGKRDGNLLDIGCGFGEIDVLLAQRTDFNIIACDISETCVNQARADAKTLGLESRILYELADVYKLPYQNEQFDVVVSFGYTSAATYKGAQSEAARVLKRGGLFICDFVHPMSLYKIVHLPRRLNKFIRSHGKYYNILTAKAIKDYYSAYGLDFMAQKFFNTYPPLDFLPENTLLFFEKSIGKVFSRFLGRVRIVCFRKR